MSSSDDDSNEVNVAFVVRLPRTSSNAPVRNVSKTPIHASNNGDHSNNVPKKPSPTNLVIKEMANVKTSGNTITSKTGSGVSPPPLVKHGQVSSAELEKRLQASHDAQIQLSERLRKTEHELDTVRQQFEKAQRECKLLRLEGTKEQNSLSLLREQAEAKSHAIEEAKQAIQKKYDACESRANLMEDKLRKSEQVLGEQREAMEKWKEKEKRLSEECAARALRTQLAESQLAKVQRELVSHKQELEELRHSIPDEQGAKRSDKLRRELEAAARNTRVLSGRLTRLQRLCDAQKEELEKLSAENGRLHTALRRASEQMLLRSRPATPSEQELKAQLDIAREVLLRMHSAMQTVKGEKIRLQEQLQQAKVDILSSHLASKEKSHSSPTAESAFTLVTKQHQVADQRELEQLLADLAAANEREADLQEQLTYAQRQSDASRGKLSSLEQENELLTAQLTRLCAQRKDEKDPSKMMDQLKEEEVRLLNVRLASAEKSVDQLKKQLDAANQLLTESKDAKEKAEALKDRWRRLESAMSSHAQQSGLHVFYEQKLEMLEQEVIELRRRLLASEQQKQAMQGELSVRNARKPPIASKLNLLNRTSSLQG